MRAGSVSVARQPRKGDGASWRMPLLASVVLAAVFIVVAALRVPLGVRGEWLWRYASNPPLHRLLVAVPVFVCFLVVFYLCVRIIDRAGRPARIAVLCALLLGVFILHLTAAGLGQYGLMEHAWTTMMPGAAGAYFLEAEDLREGTLTVAPGMTSPTTYLDDFDIYIDRPWTDFGYTSNTRLNVHPPGNTLLLYGIQHLMSALPGLRDFTLKTAVFLSREVAESYPPEEFASMSAAQATRLAAVFLSTFILQFLAALVFLPAFFLARRLVDNRRALLAALLAATLPSLFLFEPGPDQLYPLIAVLLWLFAYLAFARGSAVWAFFAGLALFAGLFFSLVFLVVAAVAAAVVAFFVLKLQSLSKYWRDNWKHLAWIGLWGLVGLAVPAVLLYLLSGYDTVRVLVVCAKNHAAFYSHEAFPRTYWKWLLINPPELLIFSGAAVSGVFLYSLGRRAFDRSRSFREKLSPYLCGLLAMMAIVWISGKTSGEAARLWMPLMPALVLAALPSCGQARWPSWACTCLAGLQLLQVVAFRLLFDVYDVAWTISTGNL